MNANVLSTCIQCTTFIITSIYLLCNTIYTIPYVLAFTSLTLNVLSIQFLISLFERGPYKDDYDKIIIFLNKDILLSAFCLFAGLFINAFLTTNNYGCLLILLLFCHLSNKLVWYFNIQH